MYLMQEHLQLFFFLGSSILCIELCSVYVCGGGGGNNTEVQNLCLFLAILTNQQPAFPCGINMIIIMQLILNFDVIV